jgi:hypothetical protein
MAFRHTIKSEGAAIDDTMPALTTPRKLVAFTLHASAAPTTGDVLYVRLKSALGAAYDAVLYSLNLSTASTTDILKSDFELPLFDGDAIQVEFANSDGNTFGIQVILE